MLAGLARAVTQNDSVWSKPSPLDGVESLELGCGVGVVGLCAALHGARATLTDLQPGALDLVRRNAAQLGVAERVTAEALDWRAPPDVPRDLLPLAERGVPVDPMRTSYFVGRNSFVEASRPILPRWQEKLFLVLARVASNAGDFFRLPANRVVELGSRIEI